MSRIAAAVFAFARRSPKGFWSLVGLGLALAAFVIIWFQPQKLFIERRVDEPLPRLVVTEGTDSQDPVTIEREAEVLATGSFQSLEHETTGRARVFQLGARRYLRLEGLVTSNGPDLRVYLSEIPASDNWYAYGRRFIDLGALKGNLGNQNYALPDEINLSKYKSAVIWCRRFTVGFGVAPLEPA